MNSGQFVKGQVAWNKKAWIKKFCVFCGVGFEVKPSLDRVKFCSRSCAARSRPSPFKGRKTSPEARAKQRAAKLGIRGSAHWNWRGGTSSERKTAMRRDEYRQWRTAVFERDNYTCQSCGARGCELHADHIQQWSSHPELRFDVCNGRTLCVPCHWRTPSFPKRLIPREHRT